MIWFEITSKRILILRMYRLAFYGEDWRYMGRKSEMPVIESVEFNYIGTDEQFKTFIKNTVRDYLVENKLIPDAFDDGKINIKNSA